MMTSKKSNILADKEKHKNDQVINRNISELWNGYKKFKTKFHAHNVELEQFTLKVLKLSFFSDPQLNKSNSHQKSKYLKSRKINIKGQLALIKKAISVHLRSLQIEQRLFQENQFLKQLLNNSYKIIIKEKNSPAIEIYEIKNVNIEERCFKRGLEYIFHELEDVSNKTKLKTKQILDAGNNDSIQLQYINGSAGTKKLECLPSLSRENTSITGTNTGQILNVIPEVTDASEIEAAKPEKFNLQIGLDQSNSQYEISNVSKTVNNNIETILQNISNKSFNALIIDVKPVCVEAVLDIKDTRDQNEVVQKTEVSSAKIRSIEKELIIGSDIREKVNAKSLKNISTLIPNDSVLNYIGLFYPLPLLFKKAFRYDDAAHARKKVGKLILQKEIACDELQRTNSESEFKDECVALENSNLTCAGSGEGENISKGDHEECLNLSEIKTVEFYDIPSDTDIHDYTVSWIEKQNERDFYYIKHPENLENDTLTNDLPTKRKSIMKRSFYSARQDNFKDYLQNIITYSEEFYNKKGSSSVIIPSETKRKRQREKINSPINSSAESNYAGKYKTKNILEHNTHYSNYKLPKMPDMNKSYQIVFQQNMPQGFSLKFVKSKEKDVSTLIVSNRYPISKPSFPKTRLYKK